MSMLTISADDHSLMRNFHRPEDEKRMVVVLDEAEFDAWLEPSFVDPQKKLRCCDPRVLVAN